MKRTHWQLAFLSVPLLSAAYSLAVIARAAWPYLVDLATYYAKD